MPFASSSSFEDEMEEHTLTVIKYEYQNCVYLKDEDGNLYNLESMTELCKVVFSILQKPLIEILEENI